MGVITSTDNSLKAEVNALDVFAKLPDVLVASSCASDVPAMIRFNLACTFSALVTSLADLLNQNYKSIKFKFKGIEELSKLKKLTTVQGETDVEVHLLEDDKTIVFKLKNKRKINNKLINSLNLSENIIV